MLCMYMYNIRAMYMQDPIIVALISLIETWKLQKGPWMKKKRKSLDNMNSSYWNSIPWQHFLPHSDRKKMMGKTKELRKPVQCYLFLWIDTSTMDWLHKNSIVCFCSWLQPFLNSNLNALMQQHKPETWPHEFKY